MKHRFFALALVSAIAVFTPPFTSHGLALAATNTLSAVPVLRETLPKQTLAYIRIPNLWGLLGEPKGTYMGKALANEASLATFAILRDALQTNLLDSLDSEDAVLVGVLSTRLRSPLEIIVIGPRSAESMDPSALLSVKINTTDTVEAQTLLDTLAELVPNWLWQNKLDANGNASFSLQGLQAQVHFNTSEQRLFLLVGPALQATDLETRLTQLTTSSEHLMHGLEAEIDSSGQGLFVWVDSGALAQVATGLIPPSQMMLLQASGAMQIQQLALGAGVSQGKGRMKFVIAGPRTGFRSALPSISAELKIALAAKPQAAVVLGLPSSQDWRQFEQLLALGGESTLQDLEKAKQAIQESTGRSLAEWLDTFGPEWVFVVDDAGQYSALRLRDPAKFDQVLQLLQQRFGFGLRTRDVNGTRYTHLLIPDLLDLGSEASDPFERLFYQLFTGMPSHLYWKREDNYLILAQIPQVLMDRDRLGSTITLHDWLVNEQTLPGNDAVLAASLQADAVPRSFYAWHLQLLQLLGDLIEQPIDLFALPSALELDLPNTGHYGFKLGSSAERLTLELMYEANPAELLFIGNTMTTVAVIGILAAVAIPAYQDYTLRAKVAQGLGQVSQLKTIVANYHADNGRFPEQADFEELISDLVTDSVVLQAIILVPDSGQIQLFFDDSSLADENQLNLTLQIENGQSRWDCSSDTMRSRYLPTSCR